MFFAITETRERRKEKKENPLLYTRLFVRAFSVYLHYFPKDIKESS
jgi:hypothetical protein